MNVVPNPQSLLRASRQSKKLSIVATVALIGAILALFGEKLDALFGPGAAVVGVSIGCLLFGGAMFVALRSITCPKCQVSWLTYALSQLPVGSNFIGWLFSFEQCPKCGLTAKDLNSGGAV